MEGGILLYFVVLFVGEIMREVVFLSFFLFFPISCETIREVWHSGESELSMVCEPVLGLDARKVCLGVRFFGLQPG